MRRLRVWAVAEYDKRQGGSKMKKFAATAAAMLCVSMALAFTNSYEARVLHPAGVGDDGSVRFLWAGAKLRVEGPGIVSGEMRLKVWSDEGGRGQVLLCVNLRPNEAHPKHRQIILRHARLMPVYTLFDGPLPRHHEACARRIKFRFRVWLPQPVRAHDLWIVALRKCCAHGAAEYLRHRTYPSDEFINARAFARLFLWDAANEYTDPYVTGYPGWPELFEPQFATDQKHGENK